MWCGSPDCRRKQYLKRCLKAEVSAPMLLLSLDLVGSPDAFMASFKYSVPYDKSVYDYQSDRIDAFS